MGESEFGRCDVCGTYGQMQRTYFKYDIKCECHSPNHFEIRFHCPTCKPKEPQYTRVQLKTKDLKRIE